MSLDAAGALPMKIWALEPSRKGAFCGYIPDKELSMALVVHGGLDPAAVRDVLRSAKADIVDMQLARPTAAKVVTSRQSIPDLVIWSWIAVFSKRAVATAIECGCGEDEFWPCRFQSNPDEEFFLHLPMKVFDIVDIDKSTFKHFLPVDPPLPMFIEKLVTKRLPCDLPPCFRANRPGRALVRRPHIFHELLVREEFKLAWSRNALRGVDFRLLTI